jgi:hypothetical protein
VCPSVFSSDVACACTQACVLSLLMSHLQGPLCPHREGDNTGGPIGSQGPHPDSCPSPVTLLKLPTAMEEELAAFMLQMGTLRLRQGRGLNQVTRRVGS